MNPGLKIFDSDDEKFFSYWLEELEEEGLIRGWELHPTSFRLFEGLTVEKNIQLKTKTKTVEKTLLQPHIYTADFIIRGKSDFLDSVFTRSGLEQYYYVEVKPPFDRYNMTRLFHVNQKWVYEKFGIYVNQVIINTLFKQTFVPVKCAFLKNGKGRNKRFINCKLRNDEN